MNLSKQQIDQLFAFTEKKYVRYYDIQIELVDHLAEKIEEEMNANASLTFENALAKVYASFGLFGFAKIVSEKEKQVNKANRHIWFQQIKEYFTIPKILFTVFLFVCIYTFSGLFDYQLLGLITLVVWIGCDIFIMRKIRKNTKLQKHLLLLQFDPASTISVFPIYIYFVILNGIPNRWMYTIVIVCSVILQIASLHVYRKVRQKAMNLYPDAFKVA